MRRKVRFSQLSLYRKSLSHDALEQAGRKDPIPFPRRTNQEGPPLYLDMRNTNGSHGQHCLIILFGDCFDEKFYKDALDPPLNFTIIKFWKT